MNPQEFEQQPEKRGWQKQKKEAAYYHQGGKMPKEEHPSTFDDAVEDAAPPYAYRAQDTRRSSSQSRPRERSADGPTSENGYYAHWYQQRSRLYRRSNWTPTSPWQNPLMRWAAIILGIFVLLHILPFLVSMLLVILGVLAVALLLPIFIVFGALAVVVIFVLIAMKMLGIPVRWNRSRRYP